MDYLRPGPVRISSSSRCDDIYENAGDAPSAPASMYSNLTVVAVSKTAFQEKGMWRGVDSDPGPPDSTSTFGQLLKTTVHRKPDKFSHGKPHAHGVTLNLHKFYGENGDSLGDDPDSWARLTF